jgi:hypothetical protein
MVQFVPLRWIMDTRHVSPGAKRLIAEQFVMSGLQQLAAYSEEVIDWTMDGEKSLCVVDLH